MTVPYAALVAQAQAALAAGRPQDAEPALRAIVAANPAEHFAWGLLGRNALFRGAPEEAEQCFRAALRGDRKSAQYLNLLGVALAEQGRTADAVASLRRAAKLKPTLAEAHYNLGKVLHKSDDLRGAREAFGRAAAVEPRYPGARYYLGKTLTELGEAQAAVALLEAAVADEPADEWLPVQHARSLLAAGCGGESLDVLRAAAGRMPTSALVRRAYGVALLGAGQLAAGWAEYRHRAVVGERPRAELPEPLPEDLRGRELHVVWEQGLGDVLFFARFIPVARRRGARVVACVPEALRTLFERGGWADDVRVGHHADAAPALYVGDLPQVLGSDIAEPPLPLAAIPSRVEAWRAALAAHGPPPYLAVAWRAGTDFTAGPELGRNIQALSKSVPLEAFARALAAWPGTLVAVQRAPRDGELDALARGSARAVFDATVANDDLEAMCAILHACAGYAGVSSTNVHLAASLRRPAVVLVPFPPEWRWMNGGDTSPWFPLARVVRARSGVPWSTALEGMLAAFAAARGAS